VFKSGSTLPGYDVIICPGKILLVHPEIFPEQPFDTISGNGIADFPADGYPQAGCRLILLTLENDEIRRPKLFGRRR
jgi:hypothetical protein